LQADAALVQTGNASGSWTMSAGDSGVVGPGCIGGLLGARCSPKGEASGQAVHRPDRQREAASAVASSRPGKRCSINCKRLRIRASSAGSCPMIFAASGPAPHCWQSVRVTANEKHGNPACGQKRNLKRRKQRHRSKGDALCSLFLPPVQGLSVSLWSHCSISLRPATA